ncbi:hypothetical protein BD770DRAFT_432014 [Pilaira anomala]|nr:hypothetical protein BD770DRAFT_432014 [Pilaira anomala]
MSSMGEFKSSLKQTDFVPGTAILSPLLVPSQNISLKIDNEQYCLVPGTTILSPPLVPSQFIWIMTPRPIASDIIPVGRLQQALSGKGEDFFDHHWTELDLHKRNLRLNFFYHISQQNNRYLNNNQQLSQKVKRLDSPNIGQTSSNVLQSNNRSNF